jgi:hypothetical protein
MLGKHKQTLKEKIQRKKKLRDDIDSKQILLDSYNKEEREARENEDRSKH